MRFLLIFLLSFSGLWGGTLELSPQEAFATADAALRKLTVGRVWIKRHPKGKISWEAALILGQDVVARIDFDPSTLTLTPRGMQFDESGSESIAPGIVRSELQTQLASLTVAHVAEFKEPENAWKIMIVRDGVAYTHLQVSVRGARVLADVGAARDSAIFGN